MELTVSRRKVHKLELAFTAKNKTIIIVSIKGANKTDKGLHSWLTDIGWAKV